MRAASACTVRSAGSAGQRRLVDVAVDGRDGRPERLELVQHGDGGDVARVQDQVGGAQSGDAGVREPPRPARQMGVGDDREHAPAS